MVIVSKPNNDRHFLSFSRKLFLSVISLFLVFAACFIAYQYQREKEYKVELLDMQLQDYNDRLHQELRYLPDSLWTSMLDSYISKHVNKELRVTVVDLHGNVLFDSSQNDSHELDNHIKRPEVQKALKDGKRLRLTAHLRNHRQDLFLFGHPPTEAASSARPSPTTSSLINNLAGRPALHLVHGHCITAADIRLLQIHLQTGQRHQPPARVCQKSRQERTYRHGHTSRLSAQ